MKLKKTLQKRMKQSKRRTRKMTRLVKKMSDALEFADASKADALKNETHHAFESERIKD